MLLNTRKIRLEHELIWHRGYEILTKAGSMQFKSFHWLSHHGLVFYNLRAFNKTIVLFMIVGYEMILANLALRWLSTIYHLISTCTHGIIVSTMLTHTFYVNDNAQMIQSWF